MSTDLAPSVSETQVAQLLADAHHYLAQPDTNIRQTRKELTAKRLQAGPALVLLERLARQGTALHPDPGSLKTWIQSRIPLKNWIPAALEAYRARSLDQALLQTHLDEVDLNAGSGYRRFFDEAFEAQHDSPEGLADLLGIASLSMRHQWASHLFHHPKPTWSDAQVTRLVTSLDAPVTKGSFGPRDHAKELWWGAACGGYQFGLKLILERGWPIQSEYIHSLWEGAVSPYQGPQGKDPPSLSDAAFLTEVCAITDQWWQTQEVGARSPLSRSLLERAVTGIFYRPAGLASVSRWTLLEGRLGKGAFSGLTRSDLAQEIIALWTGGKYGQKESLLVGLDQYLAESAPRWQTHPQDEAARVTLIATLGPDQLPRVRSAARQAILTQPPVGLRREQPRS